MKLKPLLLLAVAISAMAILVGCSNSPTSSGVGQLRLRLIDSPIDYDQVNIVVTKVEVHTAGSDSSSGWMVVRSDTVTYDLLVLRNGANAILGDKMLPEGKYTQLRLTIGAGSNVVVGGVTYPLDIAGQEVVKLNHNFTVPQDQTIELTLDFDASKSIDSLGDNQYKLHPVIAVVPNIVVGGIDTTGTGGGDTTGTGGDTTGTGGDTTGTGGDTTGTGGGGTQETPSISGTVSPASARASVMALGGPQAYTATCDTVSGSFALMNVPAGIYNVFIMPTDGLHGNMMIGGVTVVAGQTTALGTIVVPAI